MKQPSRPTRAQKVIMSENRLNPDNWMVAYESKDTLEVISKRTSQRRVLQKEIQNYGNRKKKVCVLR